MNVNGEPIESKQPFDVEAKALMLQLKAKGLLLVVFDAKDRGTGISLLVPPSRFQDMPEVLRSMANKMEREIAFRKATGVG